VRVRQAVRRGRVRVTVVSTLQLGRSTQQQLHHHRHHHHQRRVQQQQQMRVSRTAALHLLSFQR
jgi:hypothetical protein